MLIKLSDDEILKVVDEWVNEDWAVRYIRLNRGHWEDIAPIIARKAEREMKRQIMDWGVEQCQEHYTGGGVCSKRECPKCWQELEKELEALPHRLRRV